MRLPVLQLLPIVLLAACSESTPAPGIGDTPVGFTLFDDNAASASYGQAVSTDDFAGEVSAWYFGHSSCPYCSSQFGHMDTLQASLPNDVHILGVNEAGYEDSNPVITDGRTLPWLQDTIDVDAWGSWRPVYRDVIVLDRNGVIHGVHNVTDLPLDDAANLEALESLLLSAP